MYNILIVDDEPMICMGVEALLAGAIAGIGEIFTAHNGFEALDYIRMERIDLLITDIQMDHMSGIELIETLFAENPIIPVIVLSAHGEFEYAQKALRFGVKEYIIKPVQPEGLISTVKKLLTERESQLRSLTDETFNRKFQLGDLTSNRNHILNQLVSEDFQEKELAEVLNYLGHPFEGPYYCMLVIRLNLAKAGILEDNILSLRDRNLLRYAALNVIEETLEKWEHIQFYNGNQDISVILQFTQEEIDQPSRINEQTLVAKLLHNNLLQYLKMDSAIGISRIREGVRSWVELSKEANEALRWSDMHKDHSIFDIADFGQQQSGPPSPDAALPDQEILEEHNSFILNAKQYIDTHYQQKGLKLQEIAEFVYLSPNYLSYLFKKMAGMNLWDYVTKVRMEEGKRLLKTTDLRRYEIADRIGYESPEHFSKIFKKHFGVNLSEFK